MPVDEQEQDIIIHSHSIFGAKTRKGLVGLTVGDRKPFYMTPEEARSVAADLLQCATAAETDEVLVYFLQNRIEMTFEQAIGVLRDLRHVRDERLGRITRGS